MSQENVELVRRLYDAVASRDAATVLALYDPEVEWDFTRHPFGDLIGGTIYRGHDGLRTFFSDMTEVWGSVEWAIEDVIDAGEHVVLVANQRVRGRTSGAQVEGSAVGVWTIRMGKVVRVVWF
jgi:ketosteroid isomerase-like protein